jgi:hypothetical protein
MKISEMIREGGGNVEGAATWDDIMDTFRKNLGIFSPQKEVDKALDKAFEEVRRVVVQNTADRSHKAKADKLVTELKKRSLALFSKLVLYQWQDKLMKDMQSMLHDLRKLEGAQ